MEHQYYQYIFDIAAIIFCIIAAYKFYKLKDTVKSLKKMFEEIEQRLNDLLTEIEKTINNSQKENECSCGHNCHNHQNNQIDDAKEAALFIKKLCTENDSCQHCPFRQEDGLCVLSINQDGATNGYTPDTWEIK